MMIIYFQSMSFYTIFHNFYDTAWSECTCFETIKQNVELRIKRRRVRRAPCPKIAVILGADLESTRSGLRVDHETSHYYKRWYEIFLPGFCDLTANEIVGNTKFGCH